MKKPMLNKLKELDYKAIKLQEENDYSVIIDYIQKAKESLINIEHLSQKYKEVLITLELANIEPEVALNYIIVNLDRMEGNNELYD